MVRLHHFDNDGTARFITFSCYHHLPFFNNAKRIMIFLEELSDARQRHGFAILSYVVMPDHIHLVLHPTNTCFLGRILGEIKARSAFRILAEMKSEKDELLENAVVSRDGKSRYALWQRRCYDHNCRTNDAIIEKINYCHTNPVKAGLATRPEEWPWSSFRWYEGNWRGPLSIDEIKM